MATTGPPAWDSLATRGASGNLSREITDFSCASNLREWVLQPWPRGPISTSLQSRTWCSLQVKERQFLGICTASLKTALQTWSGYSKCVQGHPPNFSPFIELCMGTITPRSLCHPWRRRGTSAGQFSQSGIQISLEVPASLHGPQGVPRPHTFLTQTSLLHVGVQQVTSLSGCSKLWQMWIPLKIRNILLVSE